MEPPFDSRVRPTASPKVHFQGLNASVAWPIHLSISFLVPLVPVSLYKNGTLLCYLSILCGDCYTYHINRIAPLQPQHEHMERHKKRFGVRMDKMERDRKREARKAHKISEFAQKSFGLRAKLFNQKRFKEKAAMRKTLALHKEGSNKHANDDKVTDGKL
jgi:hypothetical protein